MLAGTRRVRFPGGLHRRSRDEGCRVRVRSASGSLSSQRMEYSRFYNRRRRVSDVIRDSHRRCAGPLRGGVQPVRRAGVQRSLGVHCQKTDLAKKLYIFILTNLHVFFHFSILYVLYHFLTLLCLYFVIIIIYLFILYKQKETFFCFEKQIKKCFSTIVKNQPKGPNINLTPVLFFLLAGLAMCVCGISHTVTSIRTPKQIKIKLFSESNLGQN